MRNASTVYTLSALAFAAVFSVVAPAMADDTGRQTPGSRSIIFVGGRTDNFVARYRPVTRYDVPMDEAQVAVSDAVSINPQPLPPRYLRWQRIRQLDAVSINPQPLPPRD